MARPTAELAFTAIRIEGGLLAADFLDRVARLDATEQTEADYDTPKGLKLRDEIARYFKIALSLWQEFQGGRERTDQDPYRFTLRSFLEPFCRQVLGFADLRPTPPFTLGERVFPIGFQALGGRVPLVFAAHTQALDKPDARFGDGQRRRSAFLLAQEFLNACDASLWAIVSNGLKLRILRDNPSLTRPAYLEVDLETIFGEELYPDFTAFWLFAHASRFGASGGEPRDCPLERWRDASQEAGVRARDRLRLGVAEALRSLGTGFVAHPNNTALRDRLARGELSAHGLYEQLLRLVYRLIFLATVEDRRAETGRRLVFAPEATPEAMRLYEEGYSLTRLRDFAARRRHYDRHADLWQALTITFEGLGQGQPALGLPALGGLFGADGCRDLDGSDIENRHLLSAVFSLCFFRGDASLSRVNYRDMDSEELGSVYESLLELVPCVEVGARRFTFIGDDLDGATNKGNVRKLTGSYYTPDSLVQELIRSTLDPVIDQTLKDNPQQPARAVLSLTVCDPACGSGHFLLAAARRLAEVLAKLRASDGAPGQDDYRHALRDVVGHCLYGVDKNPLAVELAKTALWLEAYTPDRPLSFLDHHLRSGDALLGVLDPGTLENGIPDQAFDPLSGDSREVAKRLQAENRAALKSLHKLKAADLFAQTDLRQAAETLEALPDDTLADIEQKRARWRSESGRVHDSLAARLADAFVAAFLMPKTEPHQSNMPLTGYFWALSQGQAGHAAKLSEAARFCRAHQVFHWWLEFPHIQARGGFSVLLGNPPWERIKLQEEEFFATRSPLVAEARHKAERAKRIALLKEGMLLHTLYPEQARALDLSPPNQAEMRLHEEFIAARRGAEAASVFAHHSGRYPLTGVGDVNTYALFAETFSQLVAPHGRAGFIVPTGIATDDSTKAYFEALSQSGRLVSLADIENRERLFPAVDSRMKFCLLTLGRSPCAEFVCFATRIEHLTDPRRRFRLTPDEFRTLNPNTRTCPVFRSQRDAELTKKIYRSAPVLIEDARRDEPGGEISPERNPWGIRFMTMFHMSNDSHLFQDDPGDGRLPLYEAKMIHQFDHRWATYEVNRTDSRDSTLAEKKDPEYSPLPRYWVEERQVLARIAHVPRGVASAWLLGSGEKLVAETGLWLIGHLRATVGDGIALKEAERLNPELARAARQFKSRWEKAQSDAQATPIPDALLERLAKIRNLEALLALLDEWMEILSPRWLMGWRDITNATNERTVIASVVPRVGVGHTMPLMLPDQPASIIAGLLGNLNSLSLDYVARQKVGGTHLTYGFLKQFPILPPDRYTKPDLAFIVPRVLELTYTAHDLKPWALDLGYAGPPFRWDPNRRARLRAELDAWYARAYGLSRDELRYILDPADVMGSDYPSETFRVLKHNELREFGEYRTRRLVLEAWDELESTARQGQGTACFAP
ncbi:Eco57I restriction-modification methylase domain-containing protein [Candidatus Methylocalor cossyra]|uniref:site-specific DNA-methyltransferase (adenine-specific) n=1 Tax=Candidatus Methylocalor cossyra TaxID=3108543 RepID=A0ABP1CCC1_9GAMM